MGLQGVPQDGQFTRLGVEQAALQVGDLGRIDGQQREAGVELLLRVGRGLGDGPSELRVGPAAVGLRVARTIPGDLRQCRP